MSCGTAADGGIILHAELAIDPNAATIFFGAAVADERRAAHLDLRDHITIPVAKNTPSGHCGAADNIAAGHGQRAVCDVNAATVVHCSAADNIAAGHG